MKRLPLSLLKAVGDNQWTDIQEQWNTQNPKMMTKPTGRVNGNENIRRYANGVVDHSSTAEDAVRCIEQHKMGLVPLYPSDAALLSLVLPQRFGHLMDKSVAKSYCRQVADEDIKKIQDIIQNSYIDGSELK